MSKRTPWLIIRCMFKDETSLPPPHPNSYYAALFTAPDIENVITYWRDISFGQLDLGGSEVTPWLVLNQRRSDYKVSGANQQQGRQDFVEWAKQAAIQFGADLSRFFGIIVATYRQIDLFGSNAPHLVCGPQNNLSQIVHEVGHGFGLNHSRSVANPVNYTDPFCVMSAMTFGNASPSPVFNDRFGSSGPGLCAPYVDKAGWLAKSRIVNVSTNDRSPITTSIKLSPFSENDPAHKQLARFQFKTPQDVTYYIAHRFGGWDRGLAQGAIVIHQLRADGIAYFAGSIAITVGVDGAGSTLLPDKSYLDSQYNLSVVVQGIYSDGTVQIQVAPAAAVQTLSVRKVARAKLGLTGGFSVRQQVAQGQPSLRNKLIQLLS